MSKILKVILMSFACIGLFSTCDLFLKTDPNSDPTKKAEKDAVLKRIIISDNDPDYKFSVSSIDKTNYVIMALNPNQPNINKLNINRLINDSYITLGKPTGKQINLIIYQDFLDYWTDRDSFWCIFLELNPEVNFAYRAYVSKERENFDTINTYLSNTDFNLPVILNMKVEGLLKSFVDKIGN